MVFCKTSTGMAQTKTTQFTEISQQCLLCNNVNQIRNNGVLRQEYVDDCPRDIITLLQCHRSRPNPAHFTVYTETWWQDLEHVPSTIEEITQPSSFAQFHLFPASGAYVVIRAHASSPLDLPWAFISQMFRHYYCSRAYTSGQLRSKFAIGRAFRLKTIYHGVSLAEIDPIFFRINVDVLIDNIHLFLRRPYFRAKHNTRKREL